MVSIQIKVGFALCALSVGRCSWATRPGASGIMETSLMELAETDMDSKMKTASDNTNQQKFAMLFDLLDVDENGVLDEGDKSKLKDIGNVADLIGAAVKNAKSDAKSDAKSESQVFKSKQEFLKDMIQQTDAASALWGTTLSEQEKKKKPVLFAKLKSHKFANEKNVVDMFPWFDADGNNQIDSKEWAGRLMPLSDLDGGLKLEGDEIIHHDSNVVRFPLLAGADGLLEKEEMIAASKNLLGSMAEYINFG